MLERLIALVRAHPAWILGIALTASIPMTYFSVTLFQDVRANLKELLPQSAPSVQTLNELERRFGGYSQLSIIIESPDRGANRVFSDDLVKALAPNPRVQSIRNKLGEEKVFFEKRMPLFVELGDLDDIAERIEDAANDARARANPLLVDLEDKEPVKLDFSDIEKKYSGRTDLVTRFPNDYFELKDGTRQAILIRRRGTAFNTTENKKLLAAVEEAIKKLQPKHYHPAMVVGIGGEVRNLVDEQKTLVEDLATASVIVAVLLALVVYTYYRRLRALYLLAIPVFVGTAMTFGIGHFLIGYLNASSAFLGPIIPGNGINFGIILLARYLEEREANASIDAAIGTAMRDTLKGTSTAAFAASIAYGSLIATAFLGFKHFGIIGGLGMILCWISTLTVLPALIVFSERRWPMSGRRRMRLVLPAKLVARAPRTIALATLGSLAVSAIATLLFLRDPFEKDFQKLRSTETQTQGSAFWDKKKDEIFGRYLSPQVILADRPEDVPAIVSYLERVGESGGANAPISDVTAITKLVPPEQEKKIAVLARIRSLLSDDLLSNLSPEQREKALRFKPVEDLRPFTAEDLPESIKSDFRELDGKIGLAVLALPNIALNLYHADEIHRVANVLRNIPLPDGRVLRSSGNFVIYADMLDAVASDGPKATLLSFLGVVLLCFIAFRRPKRVALVIASLSVGVAWLGALFVLLGLRINFLNFIALPITFGIGVDYAVNVYSRYLIERETKPVARAIADAVATTGGAVTLCSMTTIIGYASLLVARNGALISFGQVAIFGEITTLTAALFALPAWILAWVRKN